MHLGEDHRTTWFGAAGEGLKAAAVFVPPPFNLIPLGLGACCSAIAFYFAADRKESVSAAPSNVKHLVLLLVASGVLIGGCTNTKESTRLMAHRTVDAVCTVANQAVEVAFAPWNDVERDVAVTVEKVTGESPKVESAK